MSVPAIMALVVDTYLDFEVNQVSSDTKQAIWATIWVINKVVLTLRDACRDGCGGSALRLWAQGPCSRMAMVLALHSVGRDEKLIR